MQGDERLSRGKCSMEWRAGVPEHEMPEWSSTVAERWPGLGGVRELLGMTHVLLAVLHNATACWTSVCGIVVT